MCKEDLMWYTVTLAAQVSRSSVISYALANTKVEITLKELEGDHYLFNNTSQNLGPSDMYPTGGSKDAYGNSQLSFGSLYGGL